MATSEQVHYEAPSTSIQEMKNKRIDIGRYLGSIQIAGKKYRSEQGTS